MSGTVDPAGRGTSITQPPPREVTRGESLHDVVARDAVVYRYGRVARLVYERRQVHLARTGSLMRAFNGQNPVCAAMEHLLDALPALAQARAEGYPHADDLYQACLAVAGATARQLPDEAALPPAIPAPRPEHTPIGRTS